MLVNPEGIRFVIEDKLLRQMVDCFNELDQVSQAVAGDSLYADYAESLYQYVGTPHAHPILARDRVENTLTYGYFEMIGTLSKHREGVK